MLFGAIAEWPYGYYTLLRWITCITSILVVLKAFEKNIDWAKVVFIVIAILFNPLAPIYLSQSAWIPLDVITAFLFIFAIRIL
jgi:predicted membrane protein